MKRKFLLLISFVYIANISFASASSCIDIKSNLIKGYRNSNVLSLQNFLYEKGYLKATPNGYFGNGTFSAAKAYQKSVGLYSSGKVLTLTRAAIKKETCNNNNNVGVLPVKSNVPSVNEPIFCTMEVTRCPDGSYVGRSGPKCEFLACPKEVKSVPAATTTISVVDNSPLPVISSLDRRVFFEKGIVDKGFTLTGFNFSTTSNNIYAVNQLDRTKYFIGSFKLVTSSTSTIYASSSLTSDYFSCGTGCYKRLTPGYYDMFINNSGTDSNTTFFSVKNFNITANSGTENNAILGSSTLVKIGNIQFSGGAPLYIDSILVDLVPDTQAAQDYAPIKTSYFTNFKFKDEMTGQMITLGGGGGVYTMPTGSTLGEFQTKNIGIYADVHSPVSGMLRATLGVNVRDQLLNGKAKIYAPEVLITVSKY